MTTEARPVHRPSQVARRLVCACLLLLAYPQVAHANDQKQILLFHYYGADMPFKAEFDPSFARTLRNESPAPVTLYEEVLETYRFTGEAQETNVVNYLRQKYSGRRIDVVVAVLDPALIFLMRHRDQLFTGVPVVGVLAKKANPPVDFPLAGGVLLGTQMKNRVDVPLALQPTLRHLFVVEGALENTGHTEAQLREQFKPFEGHLALIYLRDLPLPEVIARVRAAPPDSAVLFVRQLRGSGSEATDQLQALSRIVRASPVPVYGVSSPVLGQGIIGGFLTDYEGVGHQTAQLTLQAAARPPSAADVAWVEAPGVPMFDWRELKRWGISEGLLPAGSVVRFREPSIWDYRALVFGALAFLVAQSAVIAALIVQHARRRRAEESATVSEARHNLATSAGHVGVWDWNLETNEMYINPHLKQLLGFEDHEIANRFDAWTERVHPEDRLLFVSMARAHVGGLLPTFELEHRKVHKDGSVRWFLARGSMIAATGKPTRMVGTSTDITERKRVEGELEDSHGQIRDLAGRLMSEQDAERARIARDLHDDASQELAALSIGLGMVRRRLVEDPASADAELKNLQERAVDVGEQIRRFAHELHPGVLQRAGLPAALRSQCAEFSEQHKLAVDLRTDVERDDISPTIAVCLYRVAQEAFHNIAKHAAARRVDVALSRTAGGVALAVIDDGRGFDPESLERQNGLGLVSLDERVRLLGGTLTVDSHPDRGTTVRVQVPVGDMHHGPT